MEQLFRLLIVSLLGGLWLSLEEAQCLNVDNGISTASYCYNGSSGKTCFTTFFANGSHPVRKPFKAASDWCNSTDTGSSLIIINSLKSLRNVESFIGTHGLANETIITDAQLFLSGKNLVWSWVKGNATIPMNISIEHLPGLYGACVDSKHGQSLAYCTGVQKSQHRYICEYSDWKSASSYRQNNTSYNVSEGVATWYDARNECLRLGGDLVSITDLQTTEDWPRLKESQNGKYWIGLHQNKWIWNSTGVALTYTNWEGGSPDEFSGNQCICIKPECRRINDTTICEYDRKWSTCNCNHDYVIVCQKEDKSDAVSTKIVVSEEMLPSTSTTHRKSAIRSTPPAIATTTTTSTKTLITTIPVKTTASTKTLITTIPFKIITSTKTPIAPTPATPNTTTSTRPLIPRIFTVTTYATANALTQKSSNHFAENQTTAFAPSSRGLFNSFSTKEILLILVLFVAVVLIIVAVILIIRKRRYGRQNEISPTKNTAQSETVSPVYATVVPDNRPSEVSVPPGNPIYADVEMIKPPTPPSSNTIYASVQPTMEAGDKGKNLVYADLDFPQKDQQKPRSADKITASLSTNYSQPYKPPTPSSNALHAEPIYLEAIDVDPTATQDPSAVYAEPMKLKKSS